MIRYENVRPAADPEVDGGDGDGPRSGPDAAFGRYGWADPVLAPAQEFDATAALEREVLLHRGLEDRPGETPSQYLVRYRAARKNYERAPEHLAAEEYRAVLDEFALFGAQASARARKGTSDRFVANFTCPDRPGVLAAVAGALAANGANIQGALMSVVARQVATTIVASGDLNAADIEQELAKALSFCDSNAKPTVVRRPPEAVDWPKPGSTLWHLTVRTPERFDVVERVSRQIWLAGLPLVALSTWIETPIEGGLSVCVVDLNFAVAVGIASDLNASAIAEAVGQAVTNELPRSTVALAPVDWPTRGRPLGAVVAAQTAGFVMTVVGHAEPGFVYHVVRALGNASAREDMRLLGATMAVLEGFSVFTLVVTHGPNEVDAETIRSGVEKSLMDALGQAPVAQIHELDTTAGFGLDSPTHELRVQVLERAGVLSSIAQVLKDANVNIVWMVSYVLEPLIGQSWRRCSVELHLAFPDDESMNLVSGRLRSLEDAEGFESVVLRPWSVFHDPEQS